MKDEKCKNCRYFHNDTERSYCEVPIWENAELHMHYTKAESWCALYEKEENDETR